MFRTVQNTRFYKCLRIYVLLQYERGEEDEKKDDALFLDFWGSNCQGVHAFAGVKNFLCLMIRAQQVPDNPPLPNIFFDTDFDVSHEYKR